VLLNLKTDKSMKNLLLLIAFLCGTATLAERRYQVKI